MDIILTALVGLGLLACGFYLGRKGVDAIIALAIRDFIQELIKAKLLNEKKLNAYIVKNYGAEMRKQGYDDDAW